MSRLAALGGLAVWLAAAPASAAEDPLPAALLTAIATLAPTTVPVERADLDADHCAAQAAHPARVRGDFDGDGREDWAMLLRSPSPVRTETFGGRRWPIHPVRFVVFFGGAGGRFEPHTISLGDESLPSITMLLSQPPGRIREWGQGQVIELRQPGIVQVHCDKAATTWFWDALGGRFDSIVTAD